MTDENDDKNVKNTDSSLPVIEDWMKFVEWFWLTIEKFPKKARFTLAGKLWTLTLEILDGLIDARYVPRSEKQIILLKIARNLDKIRLLSRLATKYQYMTPKDYEKMAKEVENVGCQISGWIRFLKEKEQNIDNIDNIQ